MNLMVHNCFPLNIAINLGVNPPVPGQTQIWYSLVKYVPFDGYPPVN